MEKQMVGARKSLFRPSQKEKLTFTLEELKSWRRPKEALIAFAISFLLFSSSTSSIRHLLTVKVLDDLISFYISDFSCLFNLQTVFSFGHTSLTIKSKFRQTHVSSIYQK